MRTCQLDGCENRVRRIRGKDTKYCCNEHCWKERNRKYKKQRHELSKFDTCQLEECNNSLEGMRSNAKYCCHNHAAIGNAREYRKRPKVKVKEKLRDRKEQRKEYRQRKEVKDRARLYRQTEKYKAYHRTHEARERARIRQHKRNAEKQVIPATFTTENWQYCLEYFDHRCCYCLKPFGNETPHQDHFVPLSKLGTYEPNNIVPACSDCNWSKNACNPEDWCKPEQYDRVMLYLVQQ